MIVERILGQYIQCCLSWVKQNMLRLNIKLEFEFKKHETKRNKELNAEDYLQLSSQWNGRDLIEHLVVADLKKNLYTVAATRQEFRSCEVRKTEDIPELGGVGGKWKKNTRIHQTSQLLNTPLPLRYERPIILRVSSVRAGLPSHSEQSTRLT